MLSSCHSCEGIRYSSEFLPTFCTICKGGRFLHKGQCVSSCPAGTQPSGSGTFDLRCVAVPEDPCADESTAPVGMRFALFSLDLLETDADRESFLASVFSSLSLAGVDTQKICGVNVTSGSIIVTIRARRDAVIELEEAISKGIRVTLRNITDTAVATRPPVKRTVAICDAKRLDRDGSFCLCNPLADCHKCIMEAEGNAPLAGAICLVCKSGKVLLNGECVDRCPVGMEVRGTGQFNLRCEPVVNGPVLSLLERNSRMTYSSLTRRNVALSRFDNEISLKFKTRSSSGMLFSVFSLTNDTDSLSIEINNGRAVVRVDLGEGEGSVVTPEDHFSDGMWHELRLVRVGNQMSLTIDAMPSVHTIIPGNGTSLDVSSVIYIGDSPLAQNRSTNALIGCVVSIMADGVGLSTQNADSILNIGLCETDACDASPCQNMGTCIVDKSNPTNFFCRCVEGFDGRYCENVLNICADLKPCKNGGKCQASNSSFVCSCPLGYTGALCDNVVSIDIPRFNGNSHLQFVRNTKLSIGARIYLRFRAELGDGILFYLDTSSTASFIALTLRAGLLRIQYFVNFIPEQLLSESRKPLNDSQWHEILIDLGTKQVLLDGGYSSYLPTSLVDLFLRLLSSGRMWLGGISSEVSVSPVSGDIRGFTGCVSEITVDGATLNPLDALSGANVLNCDPNPCAANVCLNGAKGCRSLSVTGYEFQCDCAAGFGGQRCEVIRPLSFGSIDYVEIPQVFGIDTQSGLRKEFLPFKPVAIQFHFRTTSPNAVLLTAKSQTGVDYFTVSLVNGQVTLTFNYGAGPVVTTAPGLFNDGEWHLVSLSRTVQEGTIVIDSGASTAQGIVSSSTGSEWEVFFLEPKAGSLIARNIGPALRGVSLPVCAQRCLDEPACLSIDFRPSQMIFTGSGFRLEPSTCFLGNGVEGVDGGELSSQFPGFSYYELKTARSTASSSDYPHVYIGAQPSLSGLKQSFIPSFDGCLGSFLFNNIAVDPTTDPSAIYYGGYLTPCSS